MFQAQIVSNTNFRVYRSTSLFRRVLSKIGEFSEKMSDDESTLSLEI